MPLYPQLPGPRRRTLIRDAITVLALLAFLALGLSVHAEVDRLAVLGHGISQGGAGIASGFRAAAGATGGVPVIGDALAGALRDAGAASGGNVQSIGLSGERAAHEAAVALGLLAWLMPSALILLWAGPRRWRQVRGLRELDELLGEPPTGPGGARWQARRRLAAARAVVSLTDQELLRYSDDPGADLLAGRLSGLLAAAAAHAGLRSPFG